MIPTIIPGGLVLKYAKEIADGAWAIEPLTLGETRTALAWLTQRSAPGAPNSMNKYGRVLNAEARGWASLLVERCVAPLARAEWALVLRKRPYAFMVDYSTSSQRSLRAHVDASDVTMNLCLGTKFSGGELVLLPEDGKKIVVEQRPGVALVHRGSLEHRAAPLKSGERTNLVLWCTKRGSKPAGEPR